MPDPISLHPGGYFHIYNRGNNREDVFREERNYRHFLRLYARHAARASDTFAYCLLRNHFHILVRIRPDVQAKSASRSFANLCSAYAKGYNAAYHRTGALFQRPFGRVEVTSQEHLVWLVMCIHRNPETHGMIDDFRQWHHSSYRTIVQNRQSFLSSDETVDWFDGLVSFRRCHGEWVDNVDLAALRGDDWELQCDWPSGVGRPKARE